MSIMPKLPHQVPVDLVREDPDSLPALLSTAFDIRLPKFARVTACAGRR